MYCICCHRWPLLLKILVVQFKVTLMGKKNKHKNTVQTSLSRCPCCWTGHYCVATCQSPGGTTKYFRRHRGPTLWEVCFLLNFWGTIPLEQSGDQHCPLLKGISLSTCLKLMTGLQGFQRWEWKIFHELDKSSKQLVPQTYQTLSSTH